MNYGVGARRMGLSVVLVLFGLLVAAVIANVLGPMALLAVGTPSTLVTAGVAVAMMVGFALVAWLAIDRTGVVVSVARPTRRELAWVGLALGGLAAVLAVFALGLPALGMATPVNRADLTREVAVVPAVVFALVAVVFVGPAEELVFRGFIQGAIGTLADERLALVGAAVLFGLFHALAAVDGIAVYVVYATLQGLVLGYASTRSGNLLVPALAHGLFDAGLALAPLAVAIVGP